MPTKLGRRRRARLSDFAPSRVRAPGHADVGDLEAARPARGRRSGRGSPCRRSCSAARIRVLRDATLATSPARVGRLQVAERASVGSASPGTPANGDSPSALRLTRSSASNASATAATQGTSSSSRFQSSPSAPPGRSDADDLGQRPLVVEPVKRLPDEHRVDARVVERDRLGGPGERLGRRRDPGPHLVQRLDRDHLVPELEQLGGELAGPRAEVEHPQRPVADAELDRRARIPRPTALVGLGLRAERARAPGGGRRPRSRSKTNN